MPLLQPSFRGRLRLFFAVIVIVPILAVGFVLFQILGATDNRRLDSSLEQAQKTAENLYAQHRQESMAAIQPITEDTRLASSIADDEPLAVRSRLQQLARDGGIRYIRLTANALGRPIEIGDATAIAASSAQLVDDQDRQVGEITVSTTEAGEYANEIAGLLEMEAVVERDGEQAATTLPRSATEQLPDLRRGETIEIAGEDYRTTSFNADEPDGSRVTVRLLAELPPPERVAVFLVIGLTVLFLALALIFFLIVSRTLSEHVQRLLSGAQRIGRGDFSVQVPTEGNDEFAALGDEFNRMAVQLERRLEELQRERGRLQDAIRRVGESFARGLDRVGVLEIVVQTAVDGVGGDCGRATMRRRADAPMEEVAHTGDPSSFHRVLHAAEAAVMDAGQAAEISVGGSSALAAPLSATEGGDRVLAIVSVARGDRAFSPQERDLFSYLTSQAAVSVENVDLHETVQRQAVTDELTGLFNHRRFQEVMDAEVERARRYDAEMGLIMLDIDNFKRVNDTYGHMQGDEVLRAVARVLRQSAREIDEPARYGGEEMAVALPQTDLDGAFNFAERVRKRIEDLELPLLDGDGVLKVTASFGAASLASSPQSDKEGLVAAADAALYRAKRSGKNRTVKAE
ncbi:diguanylate cyclase [Solirubrobacter sp. CPCC 204708]|uniref:Diguanylate cyclase n=1 Tax=Solirubrobacter deserti TaxID=2282478 RepID=A0ABT4RK38_9ACTN|nr:GGDEF domain-containing protein [Solirubrobacter deserti]MBE2316856.1 diguanylate cyclase [Solirubrobacter deserti]MDA0138927.1 diguanylate cyclase [Solirubrobacter deserti]